MKRHFYALLSLLILVIHSARGEEQFQGYPLTQEGAWCWFADPRAVHYTSEDGSINASYIGYIDVHGNVKAMQMDYITGVKSEVLVRSYFQPDDHNNPTFLVLPDERVLIIYSRHTDESAFYYRVSKRPGDITQLGEEKCIKTNHNTTYPSPFLMSDDPEHFYLCWRGLGWHPTIARLTLPDENDDVQIKWGPYQMVQSTGARPYAKYYSNGKDKLYMTYTTGHPDNEQPNWVYFNVINLHATTDTEGRMSVDPTLEDIRGKQLSTIANGTFAVSKTDAYKSSYPYTIVDAPTGYRDWVWQIACDAEGLPIIAMVRINGGKDQHQYYYAKWTGSKWRLTSLADGGGRFHSSNTEYCYSGGEALDPENPHIIYLSIPTTGASGSKVHEIWKYTLNDAGAITAKEQITRNSTKNNIRPFVLPGSADSKLRLCWMHGDYYYWLVRTGYPQGYPTGINTDYQLPQATLLEVEPTFEKVWNTSLTADKTVTIDTDEADQFTLMLNWSIDHSHYGGTLLTMGDMTYALDATTMKPYVKIGDHTYWSQSILGTSDAWATQSSGTDGKWYLTKLGTWNATFTYDGKVLTVYREGWIDQKIEVEGLKLDDITVGGYAGTLTSAKVYHHTLQQADVRAAINASLLEAVALPEATCTDLVLTTSIGGKTLTWTSDHPEVITPTGELYFPDEETVVTMTVSLGDLSKEFSVKVYPRDISRNLLLSLAFDGTDEGLTIQGKAKAEGMLDLTANTATGFSTNGYALLREGLLDHLRSYTVLLTMKADALSHAPRLYDLGSSSGNSLFLRANPLSAGIKYNGGTTTMVNAATTLSTNREYKLAVTFDAASKTTTIYIDGVEDASGTANQHEPYMLAQVAPDTRNYLGRTQWWDSNYANDNADFDGTIDNLHLYNTALTRKEICELQGIEYKEKDYPTALANGDFEGTYSVMQGSGVSSDRAIYIPEGWTVDYANANNNDLTALQSGDLYFANFFASRPKPADGGNHTYWVRQNWGASTITFTQDLRLPEGDYHLTADIWKSGLGGNGILFVKIGNGATTELTPSENREAWQQVSHTFKSNGQIVTTIGFSAIHTSNGSEKILGFDNIALSHTPPTSISSTEPQSSNQVDVYSIDGRLLKRQTSKDKSTVHLAPGLYIIGGEKVIVE